MKTIRLDGLAIDAKKVQRPGSRGGHISGYTSSGKPIYGEKPAGKLSVEQDKSSMRVEHESPSGRGFDESSGYARFKKRDGAWQIVDLGVKESHRGKGVGDLMMREAVKRVGPFRTSRTFSSAGKGKMESLVRKGHADKMGEDDYIIHFKGKSK